MSKRFAIMSYVKKSCHTELCQKISPTKLCQKGMSYRVIYKRLAILCDVDNVSHSE